ncbi:MAG: alpha/beta hydrolase [Terriglobales bacterium]
MNFVGQDLHYYDGVASPLKERLFRFRSSRSLSNITVSGKSWEYYGSGHSQRTLVLLPGGLGIAEAWFDCILDWENDYRVIALSYPRVGSVLEIVAAIKAVLEREGVTQVALLGTSLGGYVAQVLVREHPALLTHVILGDTGAATPDYRRKLERIYPVSKLFTNQYAFGLIKFAARKKIPPLLVLLNVEDRKFWNAYMRDIIDNQYSSDNMRTQFEVALDFARNYSSAGVATSASEKIKILIIEADDDHAIPRDRKQKLKSLFPRAQIKTFPRGGHLLPITQHDEYVKSVRDFLKS